MGSIIATGQLDIAMLILKRANDINRFEEMLTATNNFGYNADKILKELWNSVTDTPLVSPKDKVYDLIGKEVEKDNILIKLLKFIACKPKSISILSNSR